MKKLNEIFSKLTLNDILIIEPNFNKKFYIDKNILDF